MQEWKHYFEGLLEEEYERNNVVTAWSAMRVSGFEKAHLMITKCEVEKVFKKLKP